MSDTTKIEWASSTGNPWIGCTKVSPGCKNCYAETLDRQRFSRTLGGGTKEKPVSHWGPGAPRFRTKGFWNDAVKWNRHASIPHCTDTFGGTELPPRPRIFPSLCDWLDDEVPIEWLADFLNLIQNTPYLDWLLLTKRPENFDLRFSKLLEAMVKKSYPRPANLCQATAMMEYWRCGQSPPNVWIGTSIEDRAHDHRIADLLKIPAKLHFLSLEPLLEHIDISPFINHIDWVIVGGESGKAARPCKLEWISSIINQCAGMPVYVKQVGRLAISDNANFFDFPDDNNVFAYFDSKTDHFASCRLKTIHKKGGDPSEWPEDLRVREFPSP